MIRRFTNDCRGDSVGVHVVADDVDSRDERRFVEVDAENWYGGAERSRLTEGGIVHCWDKTMDAFLLFRCGEDLIHFYESVLGIELDID